MVRIRILDFDPQKYPPGVPLWVQGTAKVGSEARFELGYLELVELARF